MDEARPMRLRYTLPALSDLDSILDHIATIRRRAQPAFDCGSKR
jgi:hypothetical protein